MEKHHRRRSRERFPESKKKIKGRGVKHDSGLRSWNDPKIGTKVQDKIENEKTKKDAPRDTSDDWIRGKIDQFESYSRSRHNRSPDWIHDKFEKMIRSSDSDSEEIKVRGSPVFAP